ncbi:MAG: MCE family protein [Deltaproteobacteria bacterium]|jgi:phospholipid/cholesterol/gamma-HCH transport system substrate-binding protein|nr:MCE family protein [Deltaproteobacteria bacterium]MBW2505341.1 MCE family protein [Deltaproteobacteria bacterium]MBW2520308.1 MCE family protein [Deltaproteobacteria bacterium]
MLLSVEQKVGLFFLAAILALGLMVELIEDWRPFENQYAYKAYFNSSVGLRKGDPVRIAGVEMGKVKNISIEENRVRVDFFITEPNSIREDTVAQIQQTNMLGGIFLGLDFGSAEQPFLSTGDEVQTTESASFAELISNLDRNQDRVLRPLGDMVDQSQKPLVDAINRLDVILTKIDQGHGTLGLLVNNPSLYEELTVMTNRMNSLLGQIESGQGSFGRMLNDSALYDNLNQSIISLAELTEQIHSGKGTLGKLLNDNQLYDQSVRTMQNLGNITAQVSQGEGTLGKFYHDETLYDNLNETLSRVNSIVTKIDEGQGTIGRLVNEDNLYREAKTTLHKVEKAVDGISDTGPLSALGIVIGTLF